jgi:hypothetical protein
MALQKITILSVFMPPEVDPAQAHCNEKNINTSMAKGGQAAVSVVANPVLVPSDMS